MKNKSVKNLRGSKEIRGELETLKEEIQIKKNKSEKKANQLLIELDSSIDEKIIDIQNQKHKLDSEIRKGFKNALDSGERFLGAFSNYSKNMMKTFQILLIAFFLLIISVILLIYQGEFLVPLMGSIALLILIFYFKIKTIVRFDSKEMENSVKTFENSPSLRNFEAPKKLVTEKTSRLDRFKGVLGGFLASASKFIPWMEKAYVEYTLLAKFGRKVKEFKSTLEYYNISLIREPHFFDNLEKYAPADVRIVDDESLWEEVIVKKIISELMRNGVKMSTDVIYLFYKEHTGHDTRNMFRKVKEDKNILKNLAGALFSSGRLAKPPGNLSYDLEDVRALLADIEDFNLSQINNLLSTYLRHLDYIQSYGDFIEKNGLKLDFKPTIKFILEKVNTGINSFEAQVIDLAYKLGLDCYKNILPSKELADGFARASVSIKFNSEISLRKLACEISSNHIAVAVIRAYQEKRKQSGGELVTLGDLVRDLDLVNSFAKNRDDIEFRFLESELKEGKWYDSTSAYLKALVEDMKEELKTQIEKVQKFIVLKEAVKKTFTEVKIGTIEKAIDAQVFSAYLIMSHSTAGEFADLIDALSLRDLEKSPEIRWRWKDNSTIDEIAKRYRVKPRYDFMKYSHSAWVGVLEKGESFTEFKNNFLKDLNKVLEKEKLTQEFNIGLVLQRITPSKYSFGILSEDNVPEDVNIKDLEIARYVARLASDHVSEEEQASLMTFDRDVDLLKILDEKSIFELIRVENDDITGKERQILGSSNMKKEVLDELRTKLEAKSLKSLALDLAKEVIQEDKVSTALSSLFKKHFPRRGDVFSKRFANVIKELALIYELQHK